VPRGHPLLRERHLTLKKLAEYPIVAYSSAFSGRSIVDEAFARAGLQPKVICSAIDADVSKTYVELGMGIGILAKLALDPARDRNLVAIDADHLFRPGILHVVLRRHGYLTKHAYAFLSMFAPHASGDLLRRAMEGGDIDRARLMQRAPMAEFA
jgi:LysR family cys regulon transcriptional activator